MSVVGYLNQMKTVLTSLDGMFKKLTSENDYTRAQATADILRNIDSVYTRLQQFSEILGYVRSMFELFKQWNRANPPKKPQPQGKVRAFTTTFKVKDITFSKIVYQWVYSVKVLTEGGTMTELTSEAMTNLRKMNTTMVEAIQEANEKLAIISGVSAQASTSTNPKTSRAKNAP